MTCYTALRDIVKKCTTMLSLPDEEKMSSNVPDFIKPYVDRGKALDDSGQHDEAIAVYREALAKHPEMAVLHNNLGCALANKERYAEAATEFMQAIKLTPLNRQSGITVPKTYPAEPEQNLRAVQDITKGSMLPSAPARSGANPFLEVFILAPIFALMGALLTVGYLFFNGSTLAEAYKFSYARQFWFLLSGTVLALVVTFMRRK